MNVTVVFLINITDRLKKNREGSIDELIFKNAKSVFCNEECLFKTGCCYGDSNPSRGRERPA